MAVEKIIQKRRDTAANWTTANPTLAAGEHGWESDTNRFKIGTGALAWTLLPYANDNIYIADGTLSGARTVNMNGNSLTLEQNDGTDVMRVLEQSVDAGGLFNFASTGTFTINPFGTAAGETSQIRFAELAANGTNVTTFKAPDALVADVNYTLPSADGTPGAHLTTDGTGNLSWQENMITKVKTVTESRSNNITLQADSDLTFPIGANESWAFRFVIFANADSGAPDLQFQLAAPTGNTTQYYWQRTDNGGNPTELTATETVVNQNLNLATVRHFIIEGSITNGATAGTVAFEWAAQNDNANAVNIQNHSKLVATRMA